MKTIATKQKTVAGQYLITVEIYSDDGVKLLHRGRFKASKRGRGALSSKWDLSADRKYNKPESRHDTLKACVQQAVEMSERVAKGIKLMFGISPPPEATTAWGGRVIQKGFSIPYDRKDAKDINGNKPRLRLLCKMIDAVMPAVKANASSMDATKWEEVTLYEDDNFIVRGNTNGSYGYIYLGAWLKETAAEGIKDPAALDAAVASGTGFKSFKDMTDDMDRTGYVPTLRVDSYRDVPKLNRGIVMIREALIALGKEVYPAPELELEEAS